MLGRGSEMDELPPSLNYDINSPLSLAGWGCPSQSFWDHSTHPSLVSKSQSCSLEEAGNQSLEF